MSGFQSRSFAAILRAVELDNQRTQERGVFATANTGAGKTYAFFLPLLAKALLERCLRGQVGVKAICIDDALMCVIQYGAPAKIASFVQRKSRGGRQVGTRSIVITVLSPYSSTEIFLYRNQHLLTDPTFRKLPLNTENRFLLCALDGSRILG